MEMIAAESAINAQLLVVGVRFTFSSPCVALAGSGMGRNAGGFWLFSGVAWGGGIWG